MPADFLCSKLSSGLCSNPNNNYTPVDDDDDKKCPLDFEAIFIRNILQPVDDDDDYKKCPLDFVVVISPEGIILMSIN